MTTTTTPPTANGIVMAAGKTVAMEDSSNESNEVKKDSANAPTNGNPAQSRPMPVAFEDSSDESSKRKVQSKASPRPSVVAVEEEVSEATDKITPLISATEDSPDPSLGKAVSFGGGASDGEGRSNSLSLSEVFTKDEIPAPQARGSTQACYSELDLSITEHHRKGGGILASQRELSVDPKQFAAGCILLQAAARGDLETMERLLLVNPLHVNFRDYDRRTALHVAASEGHLDICKFLVGKHCRINRSDRWGGSPLDDAHRHRQSDVVKFLRKHGATTGSLDQTTNLITAAADGDAEEVELLLKMCVSEKVINTGDYDQRTPLMLAAGEGRMDIVRLLCEAGADVNAKDRWGGKALDDAIRNRHDDVADYLKSLGAESGEAHELEEAGAKKILQQEDENMRIEFDELEMIERIGAGAFGEIYKCRWRGTLVAAKCVKTTSIRREWLLNHTMAAVKRDKGNVDDVIEAMDTIDEAQLTKSQKEEAIADFRQEILVLRNLRHPHIVLLLAYSTTANYEVMISELMKCSLLDIFKAHMVQGTKMPRKLQILYADQLAMGMNYLHTCKPPVIHRDLKPANLLIDHSGVLKISDFGLAKLRPDPKTMEDNMFVMTGETGSYRFMAPEVYRRENYNETVDIYSYGMILYYLLSGRPPWASMNGLMAVERAANEGDRPNIPRDWDERLSKLLQQCWDENPQARPPFSEIVKVLNAYSHDVFNTDTDSIKQMTSTASGIDSNCCVIL